MGKRLLALALCICLLVSMAPAALAAETMTAYNVKDATVNRYYYNNDLTTGEMVNANISDIPDDGAAVFIFFSALCSNCQYLFRQLNQCDWLASEELVITAVESNYSNQATVQNFVNQYAPDAAQYMDIYYNENSNGFMKAYMNQLADITGIIWPFVVVVTEEAGVRTIRFADIAMTSPAVLYNSIVSIRPGIADDLAEKYAVDVTMLGTEYNSKAAMAVTELNAHRSENGLASLTRSTVLSELAMERAAEVAMLYSETFRPDGRLTDTIFEGGYTASQTAQVIGVGPMSGDEMVENWLLSNEAKLMSADYTQVGIGCYETDDTFYWAMLLGNGNDTATGNTVDVSGQTAVRILKDRIYPMNTGGSRLDLDTTDTAQLRLYNWNRGNTDYFAKLLPINPTAVDENGRTLAEITLDDEGRVFVTPIAVGEGRVYLPAYAGQTDFYIPLTITEAPPSYPITPSHNNGGYLYANKEESEVGEIFFVYWYTYDGFSLESLTFSRETVYNMSGDTTCRVCMPDGPLEITAKFVRDTPYGVTLDYDAAHGTVTLDPAAPEPGDTVTVTAVPDEGWHVAEIDGWCSSYYSEFSGLTELGNNQWQFTMPEDDVTVMVDFAETNPLYSVRLVYEGSGTARLSQTAAHAGDAVQMQVIPEDGWQFTGWSISVDGNKIPELNEIGDDLYQFTMPPCNVTFKLYFDEMDIHYHNYVGTVVPPDCENGGYTIYTCTGCGHSYVGNYTSPAGHEYVSVVTEPTCEEQGYTTFTCTGCGEWYTGDYTDPLGHDWEGLICGRCGEVDMPFTDVPENKFFYKPVIWAVENGITNGVTETTFEPNSPCTRWQIVTFLWRAAGCPEPESMEHNFTDVNPRKVYYKAMLWAIEEGITNGTTATTFSPNDTCTRWQIVTFLWRYAGCPEPKSTEHNFTDVNPRKVYFKAMLWAVEEGITNGTTATTFAPNDPCTRGQIVTFLYRYLVE